MASGVNIFHQVKEVFVAYVFLPGIFQKGSKGLGDEFRAAALLLVLGVCQEIELGGGTTECNGFLVHGRGIVRCFRWIFQRC